MQSWEDASLSALEDIYGLDWKIKSVEEIRNHLNGMIDSHWTSAAGDRDRVRQKWQLLGSMARHLGKMNGFSIFECSTGPVHDIVCRKQRDYGHKNISRFGRQGLMVRVHDKVARLENLLSSGRRPNNESIEDNIVDVVGYSCIAMMWEEGTFLLACYTPTVAESVSSPEFTGHSMDDVLAKNGLSTSL